MKRYSVYISFLNEKTVLSVFIGVALVLRCLGLGRAPWLDEISSITVASSSDFIDSLKHYDHPPLYFIILRSWMTISTQIVWLRALSLGLSITTMLAIYEWLRYFSTSAAIFGVTIFGFSPPALLFSQEIRGYPLLMLACSASLLYAEKLVRNPQNKAALFFLTVSLAACATTHILGILATVSFSLYILARTRTLSTLITGRIALFLMVPIEALLDHNSGYLVIYTPAGMNSDARASRDGVIAAGFAAKEQRVVFSRGPISVRRIQD